MSKVLNLFEELAFSEQKPSVYKVTDTEKSKILAIGLLRNQKLSKHKTSLRSMLIVHSGRIDFSMDGEDFTLGAGDRFEIPIQQFHEVTGLDEKNVFVLYQEK